MKRNRSVKIIAAAGSLILIGLCVAFCVFSRVDKVGKGGGTAEIEQPEKRPEAQQKQERQDPAGKQDQQGSEQKKETESAGTTVKTGGSGDADPYEQLEQRLADRKGTAAYHGYMVTLKEDADEQTVRRIGKAIEGGAKLSALAYTPGTYRAETLEDIQAVIGTEDIERIEPDFEVRLCDDAAVDSADLPNDPEYKNGEQYNLKKLNIPAAWTAGYEGQDRDEAVDLDHNGDASDDPIIVAVIDTGYKAGHEDMKTADAKRILPGKSFARDARDTVIESPVDTQGHGTFIAGLLTADKDNEKGIAGICQGIKVKPIRIFTGRSCDDSVVAEAVNYAAEQRETFDGTDGQSGTDISVINMSLGSDEPNESVEAACEHAKAAGIIVVCSAGNDGNTTPSYPAQYAMGVGSTGPTDKISYYSQRLAVENGAGYENKVWVTAPGESIRGIGLTSNGYTYKSGTSFSAPEVAALAALCKSVHNDYSQEDFMELLRTSADEQNGTAGKIDGQDVQYGWGVVYYDDTIAALIKQPAEQFASLKITAQNEAGSAIKDAEVTVKDITDSAKGAEVTASEGIWTIETGHRYRYEVNAPDPYESKTGTFKANGKDRTIQVVLKGGAYPVTIEVVDREGAQIRSPKMEVKVYSKTGAVYEKQDGHYILPNGKFECRVSDTNAIDTVQTFLVDDQKDKDLEQGKTVQVILRKDHLTVRMKNQSGSVKETDHYLSTLVKSRTTRMVQVINASGQRQTVEASGILLSELIKQAGGAGECLQKISVEAIDPSGEGDIRQVDMSGDYADRAMIALITDPMGNENLMKEGNYMRLVMDGASVDNWLYAPRLVTVTSAAKHDWKLTKTQSPTATSTGSRTYTCSGCSKTKTETIARTSLGQVSGLSTSGSYARRRFTASYSACAGASDYQIAWRRQGTGSWSSKWAGGRTSAVISGLKAGAMYEIKVRAYRGSDGAYGAYSASAYRMVSVTSARVSGGKKRITVRWSRAAGAGGYQIICATNRNFTDAKVITTGAKSRKRTIKKLRSGKRYYVYVRPVRHSGTTYAGITSAVRSAKAR